METMNRSTMCSQPNLQNQVYIAIRLEYKDMKNLCLHLGGNIAVLLKNGFEKIPKIGKNNIDDDDGIWLGVVQGEKQDNGIYEWLNDRPGNGNIVIIHPPWSRNFTYNNKNRRCVKIQKDSIDRGDNLWSEADCQDTEYV